MVVIGCSNNLHFNKRRADTAARFHQMASSNNLWTTQPEYCNLNPEKSFYGLWVPTIEMKPKDLQWQPLLWGQYPPALTCHKDGSFHSASIPVGAHSHTAHSSEEEGVLWWDCPRECYSSIHHAHFLVVQRATLRDPVGRPKDRDTNRHQTMREETTMAMKRE